MRVNVSLCAGAGAVAAVIGMALLPVATHAWPTYLDAFNAKYPDSTLPQRMQSAAGSSCYVCHSPQGFGVEANCYRVALRDRIRTGLTIEQALDEVHELDVDGDGVASGIEILMQRADDPSHIGYNPGLIGPTGTDPCAPDPNAAITNQSETPDVAALCYANCDGSTSEPILTVNDFTCFINEFAQAQMLPVLEQIEHYANCDGSTSEPVLTVNDFTCFINAFAQGCS